MNHFVINGNIIDIFIPKKQKIIDNIGKKM